MHLRSKSTAGSTSPAPLRSKSIAGSTSTPNSITLNLGAGASAQNISITTDANGQLLITLPTLPAGPAAVSPKQLHTPHRQSLYSTIYSDGDSDASSDDSVKGLEDSVEKLKSKLKEKRALLRKKLRQKKITTPSSISTTPGKRGRGRPRKYPLTETSKVAEVPSRIANNDDSPRRDANSARYTPQPEQISYRRSPGEPPPAPRDPSPASSLEGRLFVEDQVIEEEVYDEQNMPIAESVYEVVVDLPPLEVSAQDETASDREVPIPSMSWDGENARNSVIITESDVERTLAEMHDFPPWSDSSPSKSRTPLKKPPSPESELIPASVINTDSPFKQPSNTTLASLKKTKWKAKHHRRLAEMAISDEGRAYAMADDDMFVAAEESSAAQTPPSQTFQTTSRNASQDLPFGPTTSNKEPEAHVLNSTPEIHLTPTKNSPKKSGLKQKNIESYFGNFFVKNPKPVAVPSPKTTPVYVVPSREASQDMFGAEPVSDLEIHRLEERSTLHRENSKTSDHGYSSGSQRSGFVDSSPRPEVEKAKTDSAEVPSRIPSPAESSDEEVPVNNVTIHDSDSDHLFIARRSVVSLNAVSQESQEPSTKVIQRLKEAALNTPRKKFRKKVLPIQKLRRRSDSTSESDSDDDRSVRSVASSSSRGKKIAKETHSEPSNKTPLEDQPTILSTNPENSSVAEIPPVVENIERIEEEKYENMPADSRLHENVAEVVETDPKEQTLTNTSGTSEVFESPISESEPETELERAKRLIAEKNARKRELESSTIVETSSRIVEPVNVPKDESSDSSSDLDSELDVEPRIEEPVDEPNSHKEGRTDSSSDLSEPEVVEQKKTSVNFPAGRREDPSSSSSDSETEEKVAEVPTEAPTLSQTEPVLPPEPLASNEAIKSPKSCISETEVKTSSSDDSEPETELERVKRLILERNARRKAPESTKKVAEERTDSESSDESEDDAPTQPMNPEPADSEVEFLRTKKQPPPPEISSSSEEFSDEEPEKPIAVVRTVSSSDDTSSDEEAGDAELSQRSQQTLSSLYNDLHKEEMLSDVKEDEDSDESELFVTLPENLNTFSQRDDHAFGFSRNSVVQNKADSAVAIPENPKTPGRRTRRASIVPEPVEEVAATPGRRTRRTSIAPEPSEDVPATPSRRTRRGSVLPEAVEEAPATPSRRTRRGSIVPEPIQEVAATPGTRTRRGSIASVALEEVPTTPSRRPRRGSIVPEEAERPGTPNLRKRPAEEILNTPTRRSTRISSIRGASEEREIPSPIKKSVRIARKCLLPLQENVGDFAEEDSGRPEISSTTEESAPKSAKKKCKSLEPVIEDDIELQPNEPDSTDVAKESEIEVAKSPIREKLAKVNNDTQISPTKKTKKTKTKLNSSGASEKDAAETPTKGDEVITEKQSSGKKSKKAQLKSSGRVSEKISSPVSGNSKDATPAKGDTEESVSEIQTSGKEKSKRAQLNLSGSKTFPTVVISKLETPVNVYGEPNERSAKKKSKNSPLNFSGNLSVKISSPMADISEKAQTPADRDEMFPGREVSSKKSKRAQLNLSGSSLARNVPEISEDENDVFVDNETSSARSKLAAFLTSPLVVEKKTKKRVATSDADLEIQKPKKGKSKKLNSDSVSVEDSASPEKLTETGISPMVVLEKLVPFSGEVHEKKKKKKDKKTDDTIEDSRIEIEDSISRKGKKKKRKADSEISVVDGPHKKSKNSKPSEDTILDGTQIFPEDDVITGEKSKKKKKKKHSSQYELSALASLPVELEPLPEHFLKDLAEVKPHSKIRRGVDMVQDAEDNSERIKKKNKKKEKREKTAAGFIPIPTPSMTRFGAVSLTGVMPGRETAAASFKHDRLFGSTVKRAPTSKMLAIKKKQNAAKNYLKNVGNF